MKMLQDIFNKHLGEELEFTKLTSHLIVKKLKEEKYIKLSKAKQNKLVAAIRDYLGKGNLADNMSIAIDDDGNVQVSAGSLGDVPVLDLNEFAEAEIQRLLEKIPDMVNDLVENFGDTILRDFKKHRHALLRDHKNNQGSFEKTLRQRWGKALDLLEQFILLSQEIGSEYNDYIRQSVDESITPRFEVLSRSHARSCQVALEVLVLLKNGFADGAHARWRTLHEIAVEANIINGGDDDLALRFLNHDIIQKHQSAQTYQEHCSELDCEPLSTEEISRLESAYEELICDYGREYKEQYGWASQLVGKRKPKFSDLENLAKFDLMRPFYKLACLNVHSGPRGLLFRLGLSDEQQNHILLAGPSSNGLGDPIQNTAYSLLQTTFSLLTYNVNLDCLVAINALSRLEIELFGIVDEIIHTDIGSNEGPEENLGNQLKPGNND